MLRQRSNAAALLALFLFASPPASRAADDAAKPAAAASSSRQIVARAKFLLLPVKTGAPSRHVSVSLHGKILRAFSIELADSDPQWWARLDISAWRGQTLTISADRLPAGSHALSAIDQGDSLKDAKNLYREALRPQFHFSAQRGWNNDPNGLVFAGGVYHLFFQHNPYGWNWGNMHWGHAVSKDLVHWREVGEALYPDKMGPMFSGSAVVDWHNTSGLGTGGKPPIILIYTAAGNPTVQCLAYSNDGGKTFSKYAGNPVLRQITGGNRDPKVFWHEPTKAWVMVLYVEKAKKHTIHILTSPNLKDWTIQSQVDGFFECPDLFELAVSGTPNKKWLLTAGSAEYMLGAFDGKKFTPETPKLPGHQGRGFYAAQTFSDIPATDSRRLQFGWLQAPTPGMPFNQAMTVPMELGLKETADGPRLTRVPAREVEALRTSVAKLTNLVVKPGAENPLSKASGELLDIVGALEPGTASKVTLTVRGIPLVYDVAKQELSLNGQRTRLPLINGKLDFRILVDRTALEIFARGGLSYIPMPVIAARDNRAIAVSVAGGPVTFDSLEVYRLKSIWGASRETRKTTPKKGANK